MQNTIYQLQNPNLNLGLVITIVYQNLHSWGTYDMYNLNFGKNMLGFLQYTVKLINSQSWRIVN